MKNIIVVGAGFSGSIIARRIAEDMNQKVRVIEKRNHNGGNAYDEYDENGILIQKYGPHYLNTNNYNVIKFLKQYANLYPHDAKLLSYIDGEYIQLPFNFKTMQQLVGYENSEILLKKMREYFRGRDRVPIFEILQCEDKDISNYGNLLFEKAFKTYTAKQWGVNPDEIDRSVIDRVPMAMNFDERYLNKDFQYLVKEGFTSIFDNMLDHENIEVINNTNAMNFIILEENHRISFNGDQIDLLIYTGAIDELFGYKYGTLPYRSLDIHYDYYDVESKLPCEIISYPQAEGYTRSTEYKKITLNCDAKKTIVATEYPCEYNPNDPKSNIPYYPTLTKASQELYRLYLHEAEKYGNIILCGRLAEFKYYNMDVCIEHALEKFEKIKKNWSYK
ncbi:UDP-galactopyranose mutase [[Clostridium] innocuum]|nr:UDP-galactopyranose mutase [[Clostridium] innocuum]